MSQIIESLRSMGGPGWQDKVFAIGQWIFVLTLIEPILNPATVIPLSTSLLTGSILAVFAYTYYTKQMRYAAVSSFATAAAWFLVAFLRHP